MASVVTADVVPDAGVVDERHVVPQPCHSKAVLKYAQNKNDLTDYSSSVYPNPS